VRYAPGARARHARISKNASEELRNALHALDFEALSSEARAQTLQVVLTQARRRDAFTLWHLLSRVNDTERPQVYDRMATLVGPPAGVTREAHWR